MLATITAAPRIAVQTGVPSAETTAVMSHANANTRVAIAGRATCDTLELTTAVTNASESTTSAQTLKRRIAEIIALITQDAGGTENLPSRAGKDRVPVVSVKDGGPSM